MKDRILITGCYGQDGSYLTEQMVKKGYEVHGVCRSDLSKNSELIKGELADKGIYLVEHNESLIEGEEIAGLIANLQPELLFHVAAMHYSSEHKESDRLIEDKILFENNVRATHNILNACIKHSPSTHVVTAGSCLVFDASDTIIQKEDTKYETGSMYGLAKATEASLVNYYRQNGLHASQAILYNHESHRRAGTFVTKKIADGLKEIKAGKRKRLSLGNIYVQKDWGFAADYTKGMYLMATADCPADYVLATGELHTIEEYIKECARQLDMDGYDSYIDTDSVTISRKITGQLRGDPSRAEKELKWRRDYGFEDIVNDIIQYSK